MLAITYIVICHWGVELWNCKRSDIDYLKMAEFKFIVKDTKSNAKNITKSISIHSDYQGVYFW